MNKDGNGESDQVRVKLLVIGYAYQCQEVVLGKTRK